MSSRALVSGSKIYFPLISNRAGFHDSHNMAMPNRMFQCRYSTDVKERRIFRLHLLRSFDRQKNQKLLPVFACPPLQGRSFILAILFAKLARLFDGLTQVAKIEKSSMAGVFTPSCSQWQISTLGQKMKRIDINPFQPHKKKNTPGRMYSYIKYV